MNAARLHDRSGAAALVYEDAPVPEAREDEVLVRVHAAAVCAYGAPMVAHLHHSHGRA